eukprot:GHUV01038512.1.p1 GENE.GHUV01038512.1~~GHUV01038512.1.p1  ORF type:complete len:117 (+),score=17.37 GHUV01038512.1:450-800(+)
MCCCSATQQPAVLMGNDRVCIHQAGKLVSDTRAEHNKAVSWLTETRYPLGSTTSSNIAQNHSHLLRHLALLPSELRPDPLLTCQLRQHHGDETQPFDLRDTTGSNDQRICTLQGCS